MEYRHWEDGIQSQRLSWPQMLEGSSKLLWPKRVFLKVGQLLVDKPGAVCLVLH